MIILILFAFLGGIFTILSPCILPILPIVLSGSITGGKRRPMGVVTGFILSFTFFTLFLSVIVRATGLSADALRVVAVIVIAFFGTSLLIPQLQIAIEKLFSRLALLTPKQNTNDGFFSGMLVGVSLGLVWTPCVGPILASIITVAATSSVGLDAVIITLAYAAGTSIPLLAITYGGRNLLTKHPWLLTHTAHIQKGFGILMLLAALAIFFSWDRKFQTYILETFPNYGTGLTKLEDNALVKKQLEDMKAKPKGGRMVNAPEFIMGGQWFNSEPLTIKELRGNVVLVDFWTYTCINCIRTLPYLRSWHEKYKDKGLVIVGVHTPEFEFEKNPENVKKAMKDFGIEYPVMQDNDYATWQAYANHYWPAKYLVNQEGSIVYTHFGEGDYDETEEKIQGLLSIDMPVRNPTYQVMARTPETYLGSLRGDYSRIQITGTWTKSEEYARPSKGSAMTMRFNAAKVFLVMRGRGSLNVYLDETLVKTVTVDGDKLYDLIDLPLPGEHILKLEFLDSNLELYAFTFG
ncbi:MAG TPA: cytochrome c biogenesis protein DipZ [Patescibacteria group bacterium]|nr:cytochrome c biogenesis protein DipZ [Patescibacteria group bacterium]